MENINVDMIRPIPQKFWIDSAPILQKADQILKELLDSLGCDLAEELYIKFHNSTILFKDPLNQKFHHGYEGIFEPDIAILHTYPELAKNFLRPSGVESSDREKVRSILQEILPFIEEIASLIQMLKDNATALILADDSADNFLICFEYLNKFHTSMLLMQSHILEQFHCRASYNPSCLINQN